MQPPADAFRPPEDNLEARWARLLSWVRHRFDREAGLEAILFLIGIQARGLGYEPGLDKDTKQGLIMEGTYCAFEAIGLYERMGMEADGAWIWARTQTLPSLSLQDQEQLLKRAVVTYFEQHHPDLL